MRRYDNSGPPMNMNYNQGGGGRGYDKNYSNTPAGASSFLTKNQRKRHGKRQRLEDEEAEEAKRSTTVTHPEDLCLVLCDDNTCNGKSVLAAWTKIEAKLSELVMDHVLASTYAETPPATVPSFDAGTLYRGYKQIKCNDELSKEFLLNAVPKIRDTFEGIKLAVLPINDLPPRPRAIVWLPKIQPTWTKILATLLLQNPSVPMDDWYIQKVDEISSSLAIHLHINEESIEPLEKLGNQLFFGVRHCKLKVIPVTQRDKPSQEEQQDAADASDDS